MDKTRLEAFSDGVIAIIITIMVLELKAPTGSNVESILPLLPNFLSYLLSFVYVAIYWNNHHHLFKLVKKIDGKVLWANNMLLFFLSLIPFVTAWIGQYPHDYIPVMAYGVVILLAAISYYILTRCLLSNHSSDSHIARALGSDRKAQFSLVMYFLAVPCAALNTTYSFILFVIVALIWIIPDCRIEQILKG